MYKAQNPEDLLRLKMWLKKKGISLLNLAQAMGYTRTYVSLVVNGRKPMYNNFIDTMQMALIEHLFCVPKEVKALLQPLRY